MGSYCYQPHHIRVTLVKVHAGNWRWRLLDHFSAQLAEGCGCRTKDIARKVGISKSRAHAIYQEATS